MGRKVNINEIIGMKSVNTSGEVMEIVSYRKYKDIDVMFEDGSIATNKSMMSFKDGKIANPNKYAKLRNGEVGVNKDGDRMILTEYRSAHDVDIIFEDGTILKSIEYSNFTNGSIKNPYKPSVCGVGYMGLGEYWSKLNGKQSDVYMMWQGMIERCYDGKVVLDRPTYLGCEVSDEFKNYQTFAKFYFENKWGNGIKLSPDKDLMCHGNKSKIYSRDTICFVPTEINNLFIKRDNDRGKCLVGVTKSKGKFHAKISKNGTREFLGVFNTEIDAFNAYKMAKEKYIKEVADKYKLEYKDFPDKIYNAMYEYKVLMQD